MADGELKRCSMCMVPKPLDAFGAHSGKPDGLQGECRECQARHKRIKKEQEAVHDTRENFMAVSEAQVELLSQVLLDPANAVTNRELLLDVLKRWGGIPGVGNRITTFYEEARPGSMQRFRVLEMVMKMINRDEELNGAKDQSRMTDEELRQENEALLKSIVKKLVASKQPLALES